MKASTTAAVVLALSAAWLIACGKNMESKEAVRQGVMNYLAKRSDLVAMEVTVTSVAFRPDEATATVHFQAKGIQTSGAGMDMQYVLERQGNQWVVKGRAGSGAPHTGLPQGGANSGSTEATPQTLPPGHPTLPGGAEPGSIGAMPNLPQGHPAAPGGGAPSGSVPPGHPTVGSGTAPGQTK